jgi:hypothetical protein
MNPQSIHQAKHELTRIARYYFERGLEDKACEVMDLVQRMERGLEEDTSVSNESDHERPGS